MQRCCTVKPRSEQALPVTVAMLKIELKKSRKTVDCRQLEYEEKISLQRASQEIEV